MKSFRFALVLASALPGGFVRSSFADDNVTLPKSRLEELERKERELDRLKGHDSKTQDKPVQDQKTDLKAEPARNQATPPVLAPPPEPVVRYSSPALDSLPAFQTYDVVDSMDLANYYYADSAAADRRFHKKKITVHGEIVGFEKPIWKRNYRILLKTPIRGLRVVCDLLPPPKSSGVFTTNYGEDLVALIGETRVPIAKVGQKILVKGECKGLSDSVIMIIAWDLKFAP